MLIPKRRSGQPQGAAKLRSDLGFDSFLLPGVDADLVTNESITFTNGKKFSFSKDGRAFFRKAGSSAPDTLFVLATDTNANNLLSTQGCTIVVAGKSTTPNQNGDIGEQEGAARACGCFIPYSLDSKVYFDFGGTTEGTTRLSVAGLTFSESDVFVFSTGARGMEIWQNGILRASNAANPTRTASSASKPWGISYNGATNNSAGTANWYALGYSRNQMPKEICRALSRDLWGTAFVQRRRGIIATLASAARRRIVMWG